MICIICEVWPFLVALDKDFLRMLADESSGDNPEMQYRNLPDRDDGMHDFFSLARRLTFPLRTKANGVPWC